ncbi:MIP family channel protein [Paenibacillus ehimensis]|uniref:MIP family channel protein n=1 Tax=Paenibacillus ehimensis TaxID=79264 RepID=A0ABT8VG98_9BACL|nr:MIP family channel protein [Paenibacillus ehimensis]MDO3679996.1 MIP family channel protein [Paenibacillus ehimensis]
MYPSWKKYAAEFIGTLVLVLIGCGSAATAGSELGYLGIAFAFGLSIVAMAYVIGPISGCHINPAVSLAMLIRRKMPGKEFVGYVIAQTAGAVMGSALLSAIIQSSGKPVTSLGQNGFGEGYGIGITGTMAFIVEIVLTFIFIYTILGVTSDSANSHVAGLVIGLSLVLVHILGIGLTGTSVNPARSFGPAVILGGEALAELWVFIVAPLIGAVLAAIAYRRLNANHEA